MIYIPTLTTKLRYGIDQEYENILYSPNPNIKEKYKGRNITIWDNHTFYLSRRLLDVNKQEIAYKHYIWFTNYVKHNYEPGIVVITPDVDWHSKRLELEELWLSSCSHIPQLYVYDTWQTDTSKLNIVGHALRKETLVDSYHPEWTHCLGHVREGVTSKLSTYDSVSPKTLN